MYLVITSRIPSALMDRPIKEHFEKHLQHLHDTRMMHKQNNATCIMQQLSQFLNKKGGYLRLICKSSTNYPGFFHVAFEIDTQVEPQIPQAEAQMSQQQDSQTTNIESVILTIAQFMGLSEKQEFKDIENYLLTQRNRSNINLYTDGTKLSILLNNLLKVRLPQVVQNEQVMMWCDDVRYYDRNKKIGYGSTAYIYNLLINDNKCVVHKVLHQKYETSIRTYFGFSQRQKQKCCKLKRTRETILAFFKPERETAFLLPTHFIVKQTIGNNQIQWCVPHSQFKGWVIKQNQSQEKKDLKICGQLFPRVEGPDLYDILFNKTGEITKGDLYNITHGLINALIQLSDHGFIHGDISEENIFYQRDKEPNQQIKIIDCSGSIKMFDDKEDIMFSSNNTFKSGYCHPNIFTTVEDLNQTKTFARVGCYNENQVGFEQDVYSVAITLMSIYCVMGNLSGIYDACNLYPSEQNIGVLKTKSNFLQHLIKYQIICSANYQDSIDNITCYVHQLPPSQVEDLSEIKSIIISLMEYALNRSEPITRKDKDAHQARLRAILAPITAPIGLTEDTEA